MYPLTCRGGFPVPIKAGRFEVLGLRATVNTTTSNSRVRIIDDPSIKEGDKWGKILSSDYTGAGTVIADVKGMADIDANLEILFPEPVKLRYGASLIAENTVPGSISLYVR
jgi:hypothetical protein